MTNHERVGKALELLREGLAPFVARECQVKHGQYWVTAVTEHWAHDLDWPEDADAPHLDTAALLRIMWDQWNDVFRQTLGHAERSLVSELREARNRWAHQVAFSSDDADRALDSTQRLLTAVSAPEADEVGRMKLELRRLVYEEQARNERRRGATTLIETRVNGGVKPWRDVITPHPDVASGRYQQAEFAADLWEVYQGRGSAEYKDPVEFFRRTYLTESLTQLLANAVRRLTGQGGDPVVQLQTNFGGGKTHAMLALYHLFSGVPPTDLPGVEAVLKAAVDVTALPKVNPVVLVGLKLSPGNPQQKPDGTLVRTLWGELAWQLGEREAYELVRADDERGTSPGDALRALFDAYGPCLILIDEWVAYARQLHDASDLPGGSFETHFSFAQALTESAKLAKNCLLVISLPASDTTTSPHAQADDVEVGGERGRAALDRLRNVIGRVESSWRPASAEEGFEIVRRRLFQPFVEPEQFTARDVTARAFYDLYRTQQAEFPTECHEADYERRLKASYPIHPEVFDRLYTDWSTLVRFQRTRGVLRLMAAVIHSLWERGDRSPLILPANIPIDDERVRTELTTRYLSDNWGPVIDKDVDGPNALPLRIDGEVPTLGKYGACRRVARTIYLGSAPTATAANRGIEDRRVKLGCAMPGETPAVFGDALRRLSGAATYLYQDAARYWYSTQPTVTKLAEDMAEELRRNSDAVASEVERRLRVDVAAKGDFSRVHPLPGTSGDVPDDLDARLVVLSIAHPYSKDADSAAEVAAKAIYETRGNMPRLYRNALAFLAVDKVRLQDLDEAVRRYLAWTKIVDDKETLDLSPHQVKQAETQRDSANDTVTARLPEAYMWLLVPVQTTPQTAVEWQAFRLTGSSQLAVRAAKKLRNEELLVTALAGTRLRMELDRVPLWRGDSVSLQQLVEDFARYPYLPRLKDPTVLYGAARDGLRLLTWMHDSFAYADSYDEVATRYRGLRGGEQVHVDEGNSAGLLVRPKVARRQMEAERKVVAPPMPGGEDASSGPKGGTPGDGGETATDGRGQPPVVSPEPTAPRRYHGTVALDATRLGADAGKIAEEVVAHLVGLMGAKVTVTLEISAEVPAGVPENVVRIVTENGRTMKFDSQGFEVE